VEQVLTDEQKETILRAFNADVDRYNGVVNCQIVEDFARTQAFLKELGVY
jgi:hypothetical protein